MADYSYGPPISGPVQPFQRSYVSPGTMFMGTPALAAALQMLDPRGLSASDYSRNDNMRIPLLMSAYSQHPELINQNPPTQPGADQGAAIAGRQTLGEDLNSVMLKYGLWRQQQSGQQLTPQERVTQGFMDISSPHSWF